MVEEKSSTHLRMPFLAFFPTKLLSLSFYSVLITTLIFAVFWPWGKDLAYFIRQHRGPLLSFPVFTAVTILCSYIQLRCGRGELFQKELDSRYLSREVMQERELIFFQYGPLMLLLHTVFFLLPFLPLLILAASVSGLSQQSLWQAIGLSAMSALLFRVGGLLLYRLWGAASTLGYFIGRAFFGVFLFLVPIYLPYLSPLRVLYALHTEKNFMNGKMALHTAYWLCLATMCAMTLIMYLAAHFADVRVKQKNMEE